MRLVGMPSSHAAVASDESSGSPQRPRLPPSPSQETAHHPKKGYHIYKEQAEDETSFGEEEASFGKEETSFGKEKKHSPSESPKIAFTSIQNCFHPNLELLSPQFRIGVGGNNPKSWRREM
jgi:hypothetical protein